MSDSSAESLDLGFSQRKCVRAKSSGARRMTLPILRKKYILKELQVAEIKLEKEKKLLELATVLLEKQRNT